MKSTLQIWISIVSCLTNLSGLQASSERTLITTELTYRDITWVVTYLKVEIDEIVCLSGVAVFPKDNGINLSIGTVEGPGGSFSGTRPEGWTPKKYSNQCDCGFLLIGSEIPTDIDRRSLPEYDEGPEIFLVGRVPDQTLTVFDRNGKELRNTPIETHTEEEIIECARRLVGTVSSNK